MSMSTTKIKYNKPYLHHVQEGLFRRQVINIHRNTSAKSSPTSWKGESAGSLSDGYEYLESLPGATQPFQQPFDWANLSANADVNRVKFFREAELAHCRLGMVGFVGFFFGEVAPFLDAGAGKERLVGGMAVSQFVEAEKALPGLWAFVALGIGISEASRANIVFEPTSDGDNTFKRAISGDWPMREMHTPGDLGWDPLGLKPDTSEDFYNMQEKELNNGRLAMVALAGCVLQEVASARPIFGYRGWLTGLFGKGVLELSVLLGLMFSVVFIAHTTTKNKVTTIAVPTTENESPPGARKVPPASSSLNASAPVNVNDAKQWIANWKTSGAARRD
ncbi:chlorophyll a-b binding protein [Pycnococcus provasolii]|eukprot:CAMPEP_0119196600 /NCGR_PEP_ID=MMETSP1316-20130426/10855_1 /TAXON_ID=41880 /ORGANISM="Pycnococcus provasolii, Strain RCC2336" /LENGTH=333 /DNA_ID=CAMNT_0007192309 /DNA_START=86 /DNA_END=1087 /DNA_ORIENTATION=+